MIAAAVGAFSTSATVAAAAVGVFSTSAQPQ